MKLAIPLLCGAFLLNFLSPNARAQDTFRTYRNARFGTTVRYPANLVEPQPESTNGDGRKFLSPDKQIELTVYGFGNARNRTPSGEMRRAINDWKRDGARLTYSKAGRNWFVLSGFLGSDIFYEKTLLQRGTFHTLIWQYPKTLKKRLDASVSRSALSFFVGRSSQNRISNVSRDQGMRVSTSRVAPLSTPVSIAQSTPRLAPRVFQTRPTNSPRSTSGY